MGLRNTSQGKSQGSCQPLGCAEELALFYLLNSFLMFFYLFYDII